MTLSENGLSILEDAMVQLGLVDKRPEALRIAFAKGLREVNGLPEQKQRKPSKFVIPSGVIARGNEYLLFKHLIINKVGKQLEDKEVDHFMLLYIEEGLEIMRMEMDQLTNLDNYLLVLTEKAK
jgi:hypothetical protein